MSQWFIDDWWLLWGLAGAVSLIAYRMRRRGGDEPLLRRALYALIPQSDPAIRPQRQLSVRSALILGGGLVLVMIIYLVYLETR